MTLRPVQMQGGKVISAQALQGYVEHEISAADMADVPVSTSECRTIARFR